MIAYIKGPVADKTVDTVIIDAGGLGYRLRIPYSTYTKLPDIGEEIKLNTYMAVREDNISLFGFYSKEEARIFELLISVSGIGPKIAIGVLSNITPTEFSLAVITEDTGKLTNISGIGKKTAQRILIELKDKIKKEEISDTNQHTICNAEGNNDAEEAVTALMVLGYCNKDALNMVNSIFTNGMSVQEIIKESLKNKK